MGKQGDDKIDVIQKCYNVIIYDYMCQIFDFVCLLKMFDIINFVYFYQYSNCVVFFGK